MSNPGIYYEPGCPLCHSRNFAHMDEQKADGSFAPGPLMRCVECKVVVKIPASLLPSERTADRDGGSTSATKGGSGKPGPRPTPPQQRLASKMVADPVTGCLNWTGAKNHKGYGRINVGGRLCGAHRLAYEFSYGPIPDGLVIDHLCRNPSCCQPTHLEAVTSAENTRRGNSGLKDAIKTHCPQGHPYDASNTRLTRQGFRYCLACKRGQIRHASRKGRAELPAHVARASANVADATATEAQSYTGKED